MSMLLLGHHVYLTAIPSEAKYSPSFYTGRET